MMNRLREFMNSTSAFFRRENKEQLGPSTLFKEMPWYIKEAEATFKKLPRNGPYKHSVLLKLPEQSRIHISAEFDFENHHAKRVKQTIATEVDGIKKKESRVFLNIDGSWVSEVSARTQLFENDKKPMPEAPRTDIVTPRIKEISDLLLHSAHTKDEIRNLVLTVATEPAGVLNSNEKSPIEATKSQKIANEMLNNNDFSPQSLLKMTDAIDRSRLGLKAIDFDEQKSKNFASIVATLARTDIHAEQERNAALQPHEIEHANATSQTIQPHKTELKAVPNQLKEELVNVP